jgi:hypothetical protein
MFLDRVQIINKIVRVDCNKIFFCLICRTGLGFTLVNGAGLDLLRLRGISPKLVSLGMIEIGKILKYSQLDLLTYYTPFYKE